MASEWQRKFGSVAKRVMDACHRDTDNRKDFQYCMSEGMRQELALISPKKRRTRRRKRRR